MTLNPEWLHRVLNWRRELPKHFYTPLGVVEWSAYTTIGRLSPADAAKGNFAPMPAGTPWGEKWDYGWFKGSLTLPAEAAGKRIVLRPELGGQTLVWADGRLLGCRDREHAEMTLAMRGVAGKKFDLLAECYAGHGDWVVGEGPVPHGVPGVPEPPEPIAQMGKTTFGIWNDEFHQAWLDLETLYQTREDLDLDSLRVAEIDAGLKDFTLIADMELPFDEMLGTVRQARKRLKPLLECVNGSTAPTLYTIGHGHMDVAWLWRLRETEFKITGTIANQLELAAEYPEYKFIQSQPHLFWMIKTLYPDVYEEVKAAVRSGHIVPEGGMWVEADTNLSGGEALIRQFLYGKRFFRDEFGVECELLWLPDVFGYSGQMPQIMRGCGIQYFATQKIFWTYNGGDKFPHNLFTWRGIDGSEVLAHIFNDYNSMTDPKSLNRRWRERVQKDGLKGMVVAFGWGDGGGGPTRDHLEFLRRASDLEGAPRTRMASPIEFFKDAEQEGVPDEHYVGELYFQAHRGTYTSQAKTKRNNRKAELALREAEMWGAVAHALHKGVYPWQALEETWRTVLLHQFHDILPGSSIQAVYTEAEAAMGGAIENAEAAAQAARTALTEGSSAVTAFNSLSWERKALVFLPSGATGLTGPDGQAAPVQVTPDGDIWAEVTVPSCGWATYHGAADVSNPTVEDGATASLNPPVLENGLLRLEFNERGELVSILDKELGRELAAGPGNAFRMYKDVPNWFDAWDIDSMAELQPVPLDAPATFELLAAGPLLAALRITRTLHESEMTQVVKLRRGSRRADFDTDIQWQERHKLLKVEFPVNIHADEGIHEIQFGHIRRPNHRSRPFDANRFEVCNHKWTALAEENRGCAVLNDSKYGVSVLGNNIALTLLKSALAPDPEADLGHQSFTYAFYAWKGSFADSDLVREGYDLNVPVSIVSGAGEQFSLLSMDAPNIVVEAVKAAEDRSGDLILRLYEAKRMATRCALKMGLPVYEAMACDMLEEPAGALPVDGGVIALNFRPFEVKTVRVKVG
jgi:alpha-mannosidase